MRWPERRCAWLPPAGDSNEVALSSRPAVRHDVTMIAQDQPWPEPGTHGPPPQRVCCLRPGR